MARGISKGNNAGGHGTSEKRECWKLEKNRSKYNKHPSDFLK